MEMIQVTMCHNPCVYKHLFRFKFTIVLSANFVEMYIQQLAVSGMSKDFDGDPEFGTGGPNVRSDTIAQNIE